MRRSRGFTLLEVLVALVVLATGVVAVQRLVGRSVATVDASARITRAMLAARALLAESALTPPPPGHDAGVRSDGLRWERDVVATPHPRLREVRVRVFADVGRTAELVEVVRVARP